MAAGTQKPIVGRRKLAVARVRLVPGSGQHRINGRTLQDYFPRAAHVRQIRSPLEIAGRDGQLDVIAKVRGGGITGQAGALRLAISRALAREDETLRGTLKKEGYLTRDPRMPERKKYGRPKARKRFQFSKR